MSPPKTRARPGLSRAVVLDRAVVLADTEGLEAVTVRRLARDFEVTTMAMYWHFRTKEDLLAGLGDQVLDAVDVPASTGDWAVDLHAVLVALVTAMRAHPQLAILVHDRILEHPNGLALTEITLRGLGAAGFEVGAASYLAMHAWQVAVSTVTTSLVDAGPMTAEEHDDCLRRQQAALAALPPDRYPAVIAHAESITYGPDLTANPSLAIDHFVAGVQALAPGATRAPG